MRLDSWIRKATASLSETDSESPRLEAQILAGHALGKDRAWILSHGEKQIDERAFEKLLNRRLANEPVAYILGTWEFYGRDFTVNKSVLIPRQETETLVDTALDAVRKKDAPKILDLGTGSGCVAITIALERPDATVWGLDISKAALTVARKNAKDLGARVTFKQSDLLRSYRGPKLDLIVTNPPYVSTKIDLLPEIADWEPSVALFGGKEGLDLMKRIAAETAEYLTPEGLLITEIADGQAAGAKATYQRAGWILKEMRKDLSGSERTLTFYRRKIA